MKALFSILFFTIAATASVDILIPLAGQDPVVGWTSGGYSYLMRCNKNHSPVPVSAGERLSLSLQNESDSETVILAVLEEDNGWSCSAVLQTIDPYSLDILQTQTINSTDFQPPEDCGWFKCAGLPRYGSSSSDRSIMITVSTGYTSTDVQDHSWSALVPVHPWAQAIVDPGSITDWFEIPFTCLFETSSAVPSENLCQFAVQSGSSSGYPGPSYYGVQSIFADGDTLQSTELYGNYADEDSQNAWILSAGYCTTDQTAIWSDCSGDLWCCDFNTSPSTPDVIPMEIGHTELPFALSMTKTRADSGILMAWHTGSVISVRHWQGQWNTYGHPVEAWSHVSPGNIAVCSDADGYWVAWLGDTSSVPEYRYIPRCLVTDTENTCLKTPAGQMLSISENPVHGTASYTVSLPASSLYSLQLFDVTGRLQAEIATGTGSNTNGTLNLSSFPCGVYTLVLKTGGGISSLRVLNIGK